MRIDLVVALPGVVKLSVAVAFARLRRALLALSVGMNGVGVFSGSRWPPRRLPPRPRPREAPGVSTTAGLQGVWEISSSSMLSFYVTVGMDVVMSWCETVGMDCGTVGL